MDEVNKFLRGIVTDRNRLYWDEFRQMPAAVPPTEGQRAIAKFLDNNGRTVRHVIGAKRRLIELLNEQQHASIHRTVTRGLDANVSSPRASIGWGMCRSIGRCAPLRRLRWFA
jgi:type I restriction enzyme S subunit